MTNDEVGKLVVAQARATEIIVRFLALEFGLPLPEVIQKIQGFAHDIRGRADLEPYLQSALSNCARMLSAEEECDKKEPVAKARALHLVSDPPDDKTD
jgi:hypothetical protein